MKGQVDKNLQYLNQKKEKRLEIVFFLYKKTY